MKYHIFTTTLFLLSLFSLVNAQSVGVGTSVPDPSAVLEVNSTTQGFLPPRMTTVQRNAIVSPAPGLMVFNLTTNCMDFYDGASWVSICKCYQSCQQIKAAQPSATDGLYTIDIDCSGPLTPIQCYCDMTTDGGGWTLALNYLHQGGTNPATNPRTTNLPLLGSNVLGTDENGTAFWGHGAPAILNSIPFTETRFYGKTSAHARIIHFKTAHAPTISYFKTGTGSVSGMQGSFTALAGHTAFLPTPSNGFFTNQGTAAMTEFPFYLGGTYHWGIRGSGVRWEVDDFPNGSGNHTYHQIWVR